LIIIGGKIVKPDEPICINCGFGLDFYAAVILTACGAILLRDSIRTQNMQNDRSIR
jgi:hypothetical protein